MKSKNVLTVLLCAFLVVMGSTKMYGQMDNTYNYFASFQAVCAIPPHIDESMLTEQDKEEMEENEWEFENCDEGEDYYLGAFTLFLDMDKNTLKLMLQMAGMQVSEKDGFIIGRMEEEGFVTEWAINLDERIFEMRFYEEEDNPFFNDPGNNLWSVLRIDYVKKNGQAIPEKLTDISYRMLPSEIPYKVETITTYLYFELLNANNATIAKNGDEELYNECMGYTDVKEISQAAALKVYPNPTNGQLRIEMQQAASNTQQAEIYDIYGRKLSAFSLLPVAAEIDISHLANGIYFLKIDGKTVKVVKH